MRHVRLLIDDLVERRLWPLALLLLAGLVAVPLLLAHGGQAAPAPATANAALAAPDTGLPSPVNAALPPLTTASGRGLEGFKRHNPFLQRRPVQAKSSAPSPAAGPAKPGAGSAGKSGGSAPGGDTGAAPAPIDSGGGGGYSPTPAPVPSPSPGPAPAVYRFGVLDLAIGPTDHTRTRRGVPRLSPLPSAQNPVAIYLGLLKGTRTAQFLIPSNVRVEGDGTCSPSPTNCQTLELRPSDREFLVVPDAEGRLVEYQLDVLRVRYRTTHSKRVASAAYVAPRRRRAARARRTGKVAVATAAAASSALLPDS